MATVTIIGSGMMGSSLAFPIRENGNEVRLVGSPLDNEIIDACIKNNRHPKLDYDFPAGFEFYYNKDMTCAINGADLIVCGVSSFGVDWFSEYVIPHLNDGVPVISVTKGLFDLPDGKLITYPDIWEKRAAECGKKIDFCAIGGPCTSYELAGHDQTEVTFCGRKRDVIEKIKNVMETYYYHISLSTDIVGVEIAVALKNGYALAVALTIGLNQKRLGIDSGLHYNSQAAVFAQSAREMHRLLKMQNADNIENLALGLGDLYVTVYGGRTRLIGILLGRGVGIDEAKKELMGVTLESLVVAERVARAVKKRAASGEVNIADFPLLMHVDALLKGEVSADIPWNLFEK